MSERSRFCVTTAAVHAERDSLTGLRYRFGNRGSRNSYRERTDLTRRLNPVGFSSIANGVGPSRRTHPASAAGARRRSGCTTGRVRQHPRSCRRARLPRAYGGGSHTPSRCPCRGCTSPESCGQDASAKPVVWPGIAHKMAQENDPSAGRRLGPFWEDMPPGETARRDNPPRRRPFPGSSVPLASFRRPNELQAPVNLSVRDANILLPYCRTAAAGIARPARCPARPPPKWTSRRMVGAVLAAPRLLARLT
jgi:hypothetical protein